MYFLQANVVGYLLKRCQNLNMYLCVDCSGMLNYIMYLINCISMIRGATCTSSTKCEWVCGWAGGCRGCAACCHILYQVHSNTRVSRQQDEQNLLVFSAVKQTSFVNWTGQVGCREAVYYERLGSIRGRQGGRGKGKRRVWQLVMNTLTVCVVDGDWRRLALWCGCHIESLVLVNATRLQSIKLHTSTSCHMLAEPLWAQSTSTAPYWQHLASTQYISTSNLVTSAHIHTWLLVCTLSHLHTVLSNHCSFVLLH